MSRRGIPTPGGRNIGTSQSRSSIGASCGPGCPAAKAAGASRIQPPRVQTTQSIQYRQSVSSIQSGGGIPRVSAPRPSLRVPSKTIVPPQPARPVYQKRTAPVSSGYGIQPPPSTNITKTTTQSCEVKKTARGAQKVVKEVTKARIAPPGARVGTCQLPSTSRRETSFQETKPVLERRASLGPKRPSQIVPKSMLGNVSAKSRLSQQIDRTLDQVAQANPRRVVTATGTKSSIVRAPVILVNNVPVAPNSQVISEKIVETSPGVEKISRSLVGIEKVSPCSARRTEFESQQLQHTAGMHPPSPSKETISVRNVVSVIPGGKKETNKVVTYEKTLPNPNYILSPAEVNRLIHEEIVDVDKSNTWAPIDVVSSVQTMLPIKKQAHEYFLSPLAHKSLHDSVIIPEQVPDEAPLDEIPPELLATMIHTEEQGMNMVSEPTHIYSLLFPDDHELGPDVIEVNSAAPPPLDDVAVPSHTLPESFYNNSVNPELERAILETEGQGKRPSAAGFSEYQEKNQAGRDQSEIIIEQLKTKHIKKTEPQIEAVQPIEDEEPPWPSDEVEAEARREEQREREKQIQLELLTQLENRLGDVVGAKQIPPPAECDPQDSFLVGLKNEDAIDYMLHVEPPTYHSRVQLRGSSIPPWFPGYYVAFPEFPDLISTVPSPTIALNAAWKHVQPNVFPEDSFLVL